MKSIKSMAILGIFLAIGVYSCQQSPRQKDAHSPKKEQQGKNQETLFSNPTARASSVYMADDPQGNVYMSWVEIDSSKTKHFYFQKLDSKTGTFGPKTSIPINQNAAIHEEGMPKIAVKGDGTLFALYEVSLPMEGTKYGLEDLRFLESHDEGKTWTAPQSVDKKDFEAQKSGNFSNIGRLPDGEIGIAWLGTQTEGEGEGRPIKFARTQPNGGMGESQLIDRQGCECCKTSIASDAQGQVYLAYRNLLPGSIRDISIAISTDNGSSFTTPHSFSEDYWAVDGCPHNGPTIASHGNALFASWFTDSKTHNGVNVAQLDNQGKVVERFNLSPKGQFIQVSTLEKDTPVFAYNKIENTGKEVYSQVYVGLIKDNQPFEQALTEPGKDANFPVIHGMGSQQVLVAWNSDEQLFYKILTANDLKNI